MKPNLASSSTPSLDHQRSLLKAEESHLLALLSSVRTNLNSLLPISTLPDEILESIFGICVSWLYGHHKPKYRLAWTQVCRAWRRISLNSSRLWQCIDLCDSRLAHEFLIRSGTAPISIISASPLKLCADNLQPHAARLETIDVFLFPDDMGDLFASIGPILSNLTSLSLKIPPISGNYHLRHLTQIPTPRLAKLNLDGVSIPWSACRNLTHLSLRGLGTKHCPSIDQFQSIATLSPRLEHIRLENINPSPPDARPSSAHLPDLRSLILSNKAAVTYHLLSVITFSHKARVQISCPTFASLAALVPIPFPWDRTSTSGDLNLMTFHEIPTIRVGRHALHLIHDPCSESSIPQPWIESPNAFPLILTLSSPTSTSTLPSSPLGSNFLPSRVLPYLHTLFPSLSNSLTALELSMGVLAETPSFVLTDFLSENPNLQRIMVAYNEKLEDLLLALSPTVQTNPKDVQIICPRLCTLSFGSPMPDYVWYNFHSLWFAALVQLVTARHAAGTPLAELEFRACQGIEQASACAALGIGIDGRPGLVSRVLIVGPKMLQEECSLRRIPAGCARRERERLF